MQYLKIYTWKSMGLSEYFRDWMRVIDRDSLMRATAWVQKQNINMICPAYNDIYKAFTLLTFRECKVVMLGQDPYPQKDVATGLAFANRKGTEVLSPSLEVIKEAVIDPTIPHGPVEFDCTLESWERQGVLLLNSSLTCKINEPASHSLVWRPFTSKLLTNMSKEATGIIYVLMGRTAQSFRDCINGKFNDIIECEHPAYYARKKLPMPDIFSEVNGLLKGKYNTTIEWYKELNSNNYTNEKSTDFSEDFFWSGSL